ncbi:hypothetical protein [Peribacillus loiseleuriae]|uniref:hypothetical protein n=1 Tax=Peribacillus loiseleuriae TaxID=1679170 RepID=UPI003D01FC9A
MLLVVLGFLFVISGLYYIPKKEAELNHAINKAPAWFYTIAAVWAFFTMFYIPFISNIFLEGLVSSGYVYFKEDALWVISILSVILFIVIYKTYTNRLESYKVKYAEQILEKENNLNS